MKIRVIKKMMAYLLVGAMVLSTPMTASATEPSIADVYTDTDDGDGSGTLSGSGTNSGVFNDTLGDEKVQAQVIGLALDKTSLSLEKNGAVDSDRLQARVLFTDYSPEHEEMVLAADAKTKEIIDKFLKWRVIDDKGNIVNNVVGLSYYEKPDNGGKDYSRVNVNAKHGGTVQVQAYIDYNNNKKLDAGEFHAEATVSVKEFANDFKWDVPADEKFFMNWEYDLNDYIKLDPETASDDVSFYATGSNAKKVTISDSGIMKVKKVSKNDTVEVVATIENGVNHKTTLTLDPGSPAKKVEFVEKTVTLDHGKQKEREHEVKVKLIPVTSGDTVTDLVKWTAKPDVVNFTDISRNNNEITAKITIKGDAVGKVKITAQATSGKKATATVVINSTPDNIKVEPVVTWTGKKPKVEVVPLGDDGEKIPVNKNGYKFEVTSVNETKNIKNIKVNRTSGAITIPTMLTSGTGKNKTMVRQDVANVKVSLTKANGKKYTGKTVEYNNTITAKQANIKNISVWNTTYNAAGTLVLSENDKNATEPKGNYKITVGSKYQYRVDAISGWKEDGDKVNPELSDAVAWASSSAKVGTVSDGGLFTALKGGTTKVKLSYVTITDETKCKAKLNSKTITIKPIQKATSLTLNKNTFVVVENSNAKNISINVKKQFPSGAKDKITWRMITNLEDAKTQPLNDVNRATTKVSVPVDSYKAGTVIKVGAFADGGAVAYAYIYVVADKTKAVRAMEGEKATTDSSAKKLTKLELAVGDSKTITPQIQKTSDKTFIQATVYSKENIGYSTDPVTYSFSKAGIASINSQTGKITAMKPGTTKLTIKTLSGKKATVTIKVK